MSTTAKQDLPVGQKVTCIDGHDREILAIEKHFGNTQVKFFEPFYSRTQWEEITTFNKMLKKSKKRA